MKMCPRCNVNKPKGSFSKNGKTPNGTVKYKPQCNQCYVATYMDRFKLITIGIFGKLACQRCGFDKSFNALDFHHTDPTTKEYAPAKMKTRSEAAIIKELSKCELLCANCHRIEHFG